MAIDSYIKDGKGTGQKAKVDRNHALYVNDVGIPPEVTNTALRPYIAFMENAAGSSDMSIVGSLGSPVLFKLKADPKYDRHILTMAFTVTDNTVKLNTFGGLAALANGCQLYYQDNDFGDIYIHDAIKTNYELVQMCLFNPSFGTGTDAFKASDVDPAKSDAYVPVLDIRQVFGFQYGVRLPAGSNKEIIFSVRDDLSTLGRFDIKVFGYDVIPTGGKG